MSSQGIIQIDCYVDDEGSNNVEMSSDERCRVIEGNSKYGYVQEYSE